jgi:hypothetical protein
MTDPECLADLPRFNPHLHRHPRRALRTPEAACLSLDGRQHDAPR